MTLDESIAKAVEMLRQQKFEMEEIAKESGLNVETVKELDVQVQEELKDEMEIM